MKKWMVAFIGMIFVVTLNALTDFTPPVDFAAYSIGDSVMPGIMDRNPDSMAAAYNRTLDSIELKFIRFSDFEGGDSTLSRLQADTLRVTDSAMIPAFACTTATIRYGIIDSGYISKLKGDIAANTNSISGLDTAKGRYFQADSGYISKLKADIAANTNSISGLDTASGRYFQADSGYITKIKGAINFNTQAMTNVDINSGSIDGVTIGAAAAPTVTNLGTVTTCDINGGTIDGVTIGAAAAPTVTNLGTVTTCDINGGTIDGVTIGAASKAAASVLNLTADTITADSLSLNAGLKVGGKITATGDIYSTNWTTLDSSVVGWVGNGTTCTTKVVRFKTVGKIAHVYFTVSGESNHANSVIHLPNTITPDTTVFTEYFSLLYPRFPIAFTDNAIPSTTSGSCYLVASPGTGERSIACVTDWYLTGFTASGFKSVTGYIIFPIL